MSEIETVIGNLNRNTHLRIYHIIYCGNKYLNYSKTIYHFINLLLLFFSNYLCLFQASLFQDHG